MLKFIGQHIVDLIARFRSDVFLEDVSSGTIASGGNLGLDSNNKIVKANVPTSHDAVTLTGAPDYITISGQEITRNQIDLANDVTGTLAAGNVATLNQDTTGNAATATALTSGDKTISGDLTVTSGTSGDATLIISADTDNNNEDDNARLWFKQDGDITEGAIQMSSNVLNIINNISASGGISFQTGTTNNTGTTDPSTGATERMSISSTGVVNIANSLSMNGTSTLDSSGVLQVGAQTNITSLGTLTSGLNIGSSSYTGDGVTVTGSDSDNTYDVFVGKRKYPRIRLIDDFAAGDTEFSIWNLGDELRMGTNPGNTNNAAIVIHAGNAGLVEVQDDLQVDGEIQLGSASDTTIARSAAGKVTIEGANVQTSQICCTHHNMSLDGGSSTVDYYFPINSLADGSSSGLYYTRVVAAYDGKIVKILFRGNSLPEGSSSNSFGTNSIIYMSRRAHDTVTYYHQTSGFQASETFDGSSQSTVVVPCGVGGANASDWVFNEGDVLGFSLVKNTTATDIDLAATIVWEYTV